MPNKNITLKRGDQVKFAPRADRRQTRTGEVIFPPHGRRVWATVMELPSGQYHVLPNRTYIKSRID